MASPLQPQRRLQCLYAKRMLINRRANPTLPSIESPPWAAVQSNTIWLPPGRPLDLSMRRLAADKHYSLPAMMTLDEVLERWIPYRLQAIETLQFAWRWTGESDTPRQVEVLVEGRLKLRGNVATIANPMIEAGIIHARALLEFLGLCATEGKLGQIRKRRPDDIAVEHFSTPDFPLCIVAPSAALSAYPGPKEDAETALVAIFECANKGLAHLTTGTTSAEYTDHHLDIACRGIPVLLHNHLYAKLGREIPHPPSAVSPDGR